ncbi:MAG: hypothetical protein K6F75_11765 [Butyrivibrio sp.]|nr:hypothetical protein [Butyrivibrio sp.]
MKTLCKSTALLFAVLLSVVFFFYSAVTVMASETQDASASSMVTDLSNPEFGEITDVVLPGSVSGVDEVFTFGFGFHIIDPESFPDGTFTYTFPSYLDFSDIVDIQIGIYRGEDEIGYAVIDSNNVITFHIDPKDFLDNPNGIYGNVAVACTLGDEVSEDDSEAEIRFSDKHTYKVTINKDKEQENPDDPLPVTPEDPDNPNPENPDNPGGSGTPEDPDPSITEGLPASVSLEKHVVPDEAGQERDTRTGVVNWEAKLTVTGDKEGYPISIKDTITPKNADSKGIRSLNNHTIGSNIIRDSVKVYRADGTEVEEAKVTYREASENYQYFFLLDFDNLAPGEYIIRYSTQDYYDNADNHRFPGGSEITFDNTMAVTTPGIDVSDTESYKVKTEGLPMKKHYKTGWYDKERKTYVFPFTIYLNRNIYNQKIDTIENGSPAVVTDQLVPEIAYVEGSTVIMNSRGKTVEGNPQPTLVKEGDCDKLTWEFTWQNSEYYVIYFEVCYRPEYYEQVIANNHHGELRSYISNEAEGTVGTASGSCAVNSYHKIELLQKTASFNENTQLVDYEILVNEKSFILNDGNDMTLSDEVKNGSILSESLKIYDIEQKEYITLDESKILFSENNTKLFISVPDGKALKISYSVKPDVSAGKETGNGKVTVAVSNNANLSAKKRINTTTQDTYKMNKVSASVSSKNGSITITKRDKDDLEKVLSGASINLFKVNLNTGDSVLVQSKDTEDPYGFVKFSQDGSYNSLIFDTLYYYQESASPAGYKLDDTKHYFIFASSRYSRVKEKVEAIVGDAELKVIDVKTEGSEYETVLLNEADSSSSEDPSPAPDPKPSDNNDDNNQGGGNNEGGNSDSGSSTGGNETESGSNPTTENTTVTTTPGTSTVTTAVAAENIPEVLGARRKDADEVPDLAEVLGARRSNTGDADTIIYRILIIIVAILVLTISSENKKIRKLRFYK